MNLLIKQEDWIRDDELETFFIGAAFNNSNDENIVVTFFNTTDDQVKWLIDNIKATHENNSVMLYCNEKPEFEFGVNFELISNLDKHVDSEGNEFYTHREANEDTLNNIVENSEWFVDSEGKSFIEEMGLTEEQVKAMIDANIKANTEANIEANMKANGIEDSVEE